MKNPGIMGNHGPGFFVLLFHMFFTKFPLTMGGKSI